MLPVPGLSSAASAAGVPVMLSVFLVMFHSKCPLCSFIHYISLSLSLSSLKTSDRQLSRQQPHHFTCHQNNPTKSVTPLQALNFGCSPNVGAALTQHWLKCHVFQLQPDTPHRRCCWSSKFKSSKKKVLRYSNIFSWKMGR